MDSAEFDKFATEYTQLHARNIKAWGESPEFFARYKIADVASLQPAARTHKVRILDFGAGIGSSVPYWKEYFPSARITCLDVSQQSLDVGTQRFGNAVDFRWFDGHTLPFEDQSFDIAFAACVFHHIDEAHHVALLRELRRVLARNASLYIFEHNPLNPLTVHAVNTCEFDENAVLMRSAVLQQRATDAGFRHVNVAFRIFFPHALRAFRSLEPLMQWLPLGAQYRVSAS